MKKIVILFLALNSAHLYGQSDFRDGYYISNSNDTIHGLIDYRGEKYNAFTCGFKVSRNSSMEAFQPGQIKAYRFNEGKFYFSKSVEVKGTQQNLFLECLVKGELNIYFFRDSFNEDFYFIEDQNGKIAAINNSPVYFIDDGVKYTHLSNQYKGVLNYYFQGHSDLQQRVQKLQYKRKPIIELVKKYHEETCTNGTPCLLYEKKIVKTSIDLFITGEYANYKTEYFIDNWQINASANAFGVGVMNSTSLRDVSENKSFIVSKLIFRRFSINATRESDSQNYHYTTDVTQLAFNTSFKHVFYPARKIRPFILGGVSFELLSFSDLKRTLKGTLYELPATVQINKLFQIGFLGAVGVQWKDFEIRATLPVDTNRGHGKYLFKSGVEWSIGYRIFRKTKE